MADKEFVEREEINGGDKQEGCRRSSRLKGKIKEVIGGDKGGDRRIGGDKRWR